MEHIVPRGPMPIPSPSRNTATVGPKPRHVPRSRHLPSRPQGPRTRRSSPNHHRQPHAPAGTALGQGASVGFGTSCSRATSFLTAARVRPSIALFQSVFDAPRNILQPPILNPVPSLGGLITRYTGGSANGGFLRSPLLTRSRRRNRRYVSPPHTEGHLRHTTSGCRTLL